MITGSYNPGLVFLSVVIAITASYAAFNLGERVAASGGQRRWMWLTSGAIAMGCAIWSMHYVGMLAFVLPVPVFYHVPTVLVSMAVAVAGSAVGLWTVSKRNMRRLDVAIAGVCLASAIVSMHYIGMAAIRSSAMHHYDSGRVLASIGVAVTFSFLAAWLAFRFGTSQQGFTWRKLAAASLMGAGIASMHYTAMAAASFTRGSAVPAIRETVEVSTLGAFGIGMTTLVLLSTVLTTSWIERRLARERLLERLYHDLEQREAKIRRLVDANIVGIFLWNLGGEILDANDAFLNVIGYAREDFTSARLRLSELTPPEWRDADERAEIELKATGAVRPFEKEYLRRDGTRVPVLVGKATFERIASEGVAFVLDLTAQKQAEAALRRSEAYLAEAQRLTRTGSWSVNFITRQGIHSSDEHTRLFGLDPSRGVPPFDGFFQHVHADDRERLVDRMEAAARAGADVDVQFRIVLPGGAVRYMHSIGHPIPEPSGRTGEYFGIAMDVTERKRADEERERLRQAEADLARINRIATMGELAASVAHEIKQPMAAAITDARTCVRWLARDHPDLAEAREAASRVAKDVASASEIVDRINLLFKKETPQRELLDVNDVIHEMVALLRGEARRHSIAINAQLADNLPKAMADRVQLQQVLLNLMVNGIDAMKDSTRPGQLTVMSRRGDAHVLIAVSDTGTGLPPGQMDSVFDAFFTTKPQGTGMGLTISRSIVQSHGGSLWATGHAGPGATFQFTLPSEGVTRRTGA